MKFYLIPILAGFTACATPYAGPTADIGSTFVGLNAGAVELNPLADAAGLAGGAAISLGLRSAIIHHARGEQDCEFIAGWTSAVGWGAVCNNLSVALGAAQPVSLGLLAFCSITAKNKRADETAAWCGEYELTDLPCTLNNLPPDSVAASCIDGRLAFK